MKSEEKLMEICFGAYRKMYKEATPSADFDKLMESGETKKNGWFEKYYLKQSRQEEIINETIKGLDKRDARQVRGELYLGCAPMGTRRK